ncbi:MAG: hypothetical protein HY231_25910 [Acidobacteria bacterium]|nr:hypothetical protein [Acidobacteriota bacterium]
MSRDDVLEKLKSIDTPDDHETFLRSQWKDFAAFAWTNFLQHGRGAIVVDLKHAAFEKSGLQMPAYYVAEGSEKLRQHGGWPNAEIVQAVNDYDPELDVVFLVWRVNDDIIHYVATDDLTPPKAYAAKQRKPRKKSAKHFFKGDF